MSITVSDHAKFCAHCGWLEPLNLEEIENDENCTVGGAYVHKEDCRAMECGHEHGLFIALWNARIHMQMNDVLLRRANESIVDAMRPYIKSRLNEDSYFVKCEPTRFWG